MYAIRTIIIKKDQNQHETHKNSTKIKHFQPIEIKLKQTNLLWKLNEKSQNEIIIINKNRKIQNSVSQKGDDFLKGLINCHVSSVEYLSFMNLI